MRRYEYQEVTQSGILGYKEVKVVMDSYMISQ